MPNDRHPEILIVDNDEDLIRGVQVRLDSLDYHQCQTANSGTQGLSEFTYGGFDLITTELTLGRHRQAG